MLDGVVWCFVNFIGLHYVGWFYTVLRIPARACIRLYGAYIYARMWVQACIGLYTLLYACTGLYMLAHACTP